MGQEKRERGHCDDRRVWGWRKEGSKEVGGKEKIMNLVGSLEMGW